MTFDQTFEQYQNLVPICDRLHAYMESLSRVALLPLFLLSVTFAYTTDLGLKGAVFSRLKNLLLTVFLLLIFPKFAVTVKLFGQELALAIDNMQGFEEILEAAREKTANFPGSALGFVGYTLNGILASLTYLILYCVRFLIVAFYNFYWSFLYVLSPLVLLGLLFDSTHVMGANIYKSITLISVWPVAWAILSAFLKGLPFANAYAVEGNYFTIAAMNIIVALAMLFSPFILTTIAEGIGSGSRAGVLRHLGTAVFAFGSELAFHTTIARAYKRISKGTKEGVKKIEKYKQKHSQHPPSENHGISCVLFCLALSTTSWAKAISTHVNRSTLFCVKGSPTNAILESTKYFEMEKVGPNLLITALVPEMETNLFLFYGNKVQSFELSSNTNLPHEATANCEKVVSSNDKDKGTFLRLRQDSDKREAPKLDFKIEKAQWSNTTRDYFSVLLNVTNDSQGKLMFNWPSLCLVQNNQEIKFARLHSLRRFLPSEASMTIFVEFKHPSLNESLDAFIQIKTNKGLLSSKINWEDL